MIVSGFINAQINSIHALISFIILIFIWSSHCETCIYVPFHYAIPFDTGQPIVGDRSNYSFICILCDLISAQYMVGLD